jgi:NAD(P)-dependent dehydrogenase (short-subunit alcohol dehydrogenase family)
VFTGGPIIDGDLGELQWLMDVNLYGVYRVTQAFAPMIIEGKGRITTIGSISGIGSEKSFGQYCMSKHAIEAFADSLAEEMEPRDVQVSVIEPGDYDSKITENRSHFKDPDEVAEAAVHALFADKPLRRYMVVPDEDEAEWTLGKHIEKLVQLNEWQAYSYSREELIAMLDEASLKATDR